MKKQLFLGAIATSAVVAGSLAVAPNAHALIITEVSGTSGECAGFSFQNCEFEGSPTIIKFNELLDGVEDTNSLFVTIDGTEWTFENLVLNDDDEIISGDWFYTPDDAADPGITAWVSKSGTGYITYDNEGIAATSGSFTTFDDKGLSHLTFFDSDSGDVIPTPAAVLPVLGGLFGAASRRKKEEENA